MTGIFSYAVANLTIGKAFLNREAKTTYLCDDGGL
jgi:hypothetical protein